MILAPDNEWHSEYANGNVVPGRRSLTIKRKRMIHIVPLLY